MIAVCALETAPFKTYSLEGSVRFYVHASLCTSLTGFGRPTLGIIMVDTQCLFGTYIHAVVFHKKFQSLLRKKIVNQS